MADGSNAEERHHRFRWTTTTVHKDLNYAQVIQENSQRFVKITRIQLEYL